MHNLLPGLRVIEVAANIATRYTGRLLADAGAEVIAIETGPTSPEDARLDQYLSANKLRVQAQTSGAGPALAEAACRRANVFLFDGQDAYFREHLLERRIFEATPTALCVATAWGLNSPYAHLCEDELLLFAVSGAASVTPEGAIDRSVERPTHPWGNQGAFATGVVAALAALQAWLSVERDGKSRMVDISTLDVLATVPVSSLASSLVANEPPAPPASRPRTVPRGMLRCSDGYVYTQGGDDNWAAWAKLVGQEDWAKGPYTDSAYRETAWDELEAAITRWLTSHTTYEVYQEGQANGIVVFPVNTIKRTADDAHLRERGAFVPILADDGTRIIGPRTPLRVASERLPYVQDRVLSPSSGVLEL